MTETARKELSVLSNAIENMFKAQLGPYSNFLFKAPIYQNYYNKLFDLLEMFIDDNGEIDGEELYKILKIQYPTIADWITIPQNKFKISEEINEISIMLTGKGVI